MKKALEDSQLVQQAKQGNRDALGQIYLKYKRFMLLLALSRLKDHNAAEDVVQDVFVSFASAVRSLSPQCILKKYMTISIVNAVRDFWKQKTHVHICPLDNAMFKTSNCCPISSLIHDEGLKEVAHAIDQLPNEQSEVVLLHLHADMTFNDIAKMKNISINTIKSRYRYALQKLQTKLSDKILGKEMLWNSKRI